MASDVTGLLWQLSHFDWRLAYADHQLAFVTSSLTAGMAMKPLLIQRAFRHGWAKTILMSCSANFACVIVDLLAIPFLAVTAVAASRMDLPGLTRAGITAPLTILGLACAVGLLRTTAEKTLLTALFQQALERRVSRLFWLLNSLALVFGAAILYLAALNWPPR